MPKTVFITGATSGFGKACAEKFASECYDLILNGRREERLDELKATLEKQYNIVLSNEEVNSIRSVAQAVEVIEKHIAQINYAK